MLPHIMRGNESCLSNSLVLHSRRNFLFTLQKGKPCAVCSPLTEEDKYELMPRIPCPGYWPHSSFHYGINTISVITRFILHCASTRGHLEYLFQFVFFIKSLDKVRASEKNWIDDLEEQQGISGTGTQASQSLCVQRTASIL